MFNYLSISFPLAQTPPQRVSSFTLKQERYAHETIKVKFRDWGIKYTNIKPGDPVKCVLRGKSSTRDWVGYVHEIKPNITPSGNFTEVILIGASYRLKQAKQRVFTKMTASDIVKQIASEYGFTAYVEDHPRIYDQVLQTGHTELQLMSRLARQCGYSLRVENTSIYFHSLTYDFTNKRDSALRFQMSGANDPGGSTLYSFNLLLGDSIVFKDSYKSAVQVGGVDPSSKESNLVTNDRQSTINETSVTEFFDSFATNIVAPGYEPAVYEAKAADERNRFPYRARIQIIGTPEIKPDQPIFLDGIGANYSGYWVVLYAEHNVSEESPNILKYTTVLDVGADSIGQASVWQGQSIVSPASVRVRNLTPNTRNVAPNDSSTLTEGDGTYSNEGFSQVTNRAPASNVKPYVWVSVAPKDGRYNADVRKRPKAVIKRLEARGVL